ncbi:MAG: hypothetical protein IT317_11265 [Anaerolineales bacterium]|nr:hypothetical protein [Anaerolineales bacterium]
MLLLPLLQDATPDTFGYLLFGYAIFLGLPALYLISWFLRRRNLERDLETIETLAQEDADKAEKPVARAAAMPPADKSQRADKPSRS